MKTVLVTGGSGYIGSHVCKALRLAGYTPVTYDDLARGNRAAVRFGPLEEGSLEDRDRLEDVFVRHRPQGVLHFAALTYVGESVSEPLRYYRNNVAGTLSLLEVMRGQGVRHLVFSSTAAVYGNPQTVPIPEDHPKQPINPYGASKWMVEQILRDADTAYGIRSVCLRYFNAAGADPDGEIGETHDPETHAVPLAMFAALGLRPHFTVFGDDYPTPDGTAIRDYIHVVDLADAHLKALSYLQAGGPSDAFNLGTGTGTSVKELIQGVVAASGKEVPVSMGPRRAGDPPVLVAASDRAREVLGWTPRHSDFAAIARTAWQWHSRRPAEKVAGNG